MRFVFVLASFLAFALSSALAAERLPDVDAAIDYLARQQNANGSIHAATDIANPEQSTSEALMALKRWGSLDRIDQESAASYLVAFSQDAPTEYLARAIAAQRYVYETPPSILEADLCNRWHQSGAFGFLSADEANVYSTAYAVAALSDSQCPDAVHSAIEFLLSKYEQSGWRNQAGAIDIDLSLRVWHALFPYRERSNVASVLDQSLTLFAGGSYSSAEREAYRLLAIMLRSKDPSSYVDALAAFIGLQSESGSWGESAYLTALALNVLSTSAEPVPNPDLGTVSGTVINAIEGLPLVGAAIELSGPIGFNEVTDALGDFSFGQLPAGIYELRLNTEGYVTSSPRSI